MIRATGLPFTKAVSTFTGRPRKEATLATLDSALVTWSRNVSLQWNGCPPRGVSRKPMLDGASNA